MTDTNTSSAEKDLYEHRNDPGEWSEEEEVIERRPRRTEVVSFRLPAEEMDALEAAAAAAGEKLSEYIRRAVALRREGPATPPARVQLTTGRGSWVMSVTRPQADNSHLEALGSVVPDYPPLTTNVIHGTSPLPSTRTSEENGPGSGSATEDQ